MRVALCVAAVILICGATIRGEKLVAVSYGGPGARPAAGALTDFAAITRDLETIRRAGFNAIVTRISWQSTQPVDGPIELAAFERLVATAQEHDLRLLVHIVLDPLPGWAKAKPEARRQFTETVRTRMRKAGATVLEGATENKTGIVVVGRGRNALAEARVAFWEAIAGGAESIRVSGPDGRITPELLALGETAGVVTRNPALFDTLKPREGGVRAVSASGAARPTVRLLESPQALMIIAFNRSAKPNTMRIVFTPDIPEAIWQDLEGGAAVHFVMERGGPVFEHTFAARDVVVLMIRKTLR